MGAPPRSIPACLVKKEKNLFKIKGKKKKIVTYNFSVMIIQNVLYYYDYENIKKKINCFSVMRKIVGYKYNFLV